MGLARFLQFCHEVSAANGGARPVLIAHNASFDNGMLLNSCWQAGVDVPSQWGTLCTYKAVALLDKTLAPPALQKMSKKLGNLAHLFGCASACCLELVDLRWKCQSQAFGSPPSVQAKLRVLCGAPCAAVFGQTGPARH